MTTNKFGRAVPSTFNDAVSLYIDAIRQYESSYEQPSYSMIEGPKTYIADQILRMLGLPTSPRGPVFREASHIADQRVHPTRQTISPTVRWNVFKRDGYQCVMCHTDTDLAVDHIYPQSKGGSTTEDNMQTLCRSCNSRKGDRLSE